MAKEYDPRMHSAEHILNQTMVRMFGCQRSFSMHLEKKKSKCDYHFERDLAPGEILEIQRRVNEVVGSNIHISEEFLSREAAGTMFNLSRIPDQTEDRIRIIKIGNYDSCPCRGEHVSSTKEIGMFRIISTGFENGVLRIRFKLSEDANGGQADNGLIAPVTMNPPS
jgi:misacylated tRNA(Ala) deacylase